MSSIDKYYKLAGDAFENSLRLHFDSIHMYKFGSYPTAYQLSLLSSEELGKALLLQEFCWQYYANGWREDDRYTGKYLKSIFSDHLHKQKYFAYMANDFLNKNPYMKKQSALLYSLGSGLGEDAKQRSTFVGLLKVGRKLDLNARTTTPLVFATEEKSKKQITLNNDFILVYSEGFLKGIFGVDVYEIAVQMDKDLIDMLKSLWVDTGRDAKRTLDQLSSKLYVERPLEDWEE
ncbi:MAG: AbiV family abortive infection protein [Candidatus Saccharimonas sp.]